eukprot:121166-Hanusia_phi.AAC.1
MFHTIYEHASEEGKLDCSGGQPTIGLWHQTQAARPGWPRRAGAGLPGLGRDSAVPRGSLGPAARNFLATEFENSLGTTPVCTMQGGLTVTVPRRASQSPGT